jgi:hypothetical protein
MVSQFRLLLVASASCLMACAESPGQPDGGSTEEGAEPQVFACPPLGNSIELDAGNYALSGDCQISGNIQLSGTATLTVDGHSLAVDGNIALSDGARLSVRAGQLTLANHFVFQHQIVSSGSAVLEIRDSEFATNSGVNANLTSNYVGFGHSLLRIENVQFDILRSWLLCSLREDARLETINSKSLPTEIYPSDRTGVYIEGPQSEHVVWLEFLPQTGAVLDALPASAPFSYSFGPETPGATGIEYRVDVVNGTANFNVSSFPFSNVTLKENGRPVTLAYYFIDVSAPELLTGLSISKQTAAYQNQGRTLTLDNADLGPFGWQIYVGNPNLPATSRQIVQVADSVVNELAALPYGKVEALRTNFQFAVIDAAGPGSSVTIRHSVINSQSIIGTADGVVLIEDSDIHGSFVQATDSSRVLLLNDALLKNECHSLCFPLCISFTGGNECNPFSGLEMQFTATGNAAIVAAGLVAPASTIPKGSVYSIVGDVFAVAEQGTLSSFTYDLTYRARASNIPTAIVTGATGAKRGQVLGQLDTSMLPAGDYLVGLAIHLGSGERYGVERELVISP